MITYLIFAGNASHERIQSTVKKLRHQDSDCRIALIDSTHRKSANELHCDFYRSRRITPGDWNDEMMALAAVTEAFPNTRWIARIFSLESLPEPPPRDQHFDAWIDKTGYFIRKTFLSQHIRSFAAMQVDHHHILDGVFRGVTDFGGRVKYRKQEHQFATLETTPIRGAVDVLSVLHPNPSWVEYRGERQQSFLASVGIRHAWSHHTSASALANELEKHEVKLVLNEIWRISPEIMAALAKRFPRTRFVSLNHGATGWFSTLRPRQHYKFLRLARERENCFYGTVMPAGRVIAPPETKVIEIPNFVMLPSIVSSREGGPPTVSLISREAQIKAWGGAVAAVEWAAQNMRDLHVLVSSADDSEGRIEAHIQHLEELGIPVIRSQWGNWARYLDRIARSVDAHLTATMTESFGLVPMEHCLLGRPVAGTDAVEWLPARWKANGQDAAALGRILVSHFEQGVSLGEQARKLAKRVTAKNHRILKKNLTTLLDL